MRGDDDVTSCHLQFSHPEGGAFVTGAVCIWRTNASKCLISAVTKITSTEVRSTNPACFGKTS